MAKIDSTSDGSVLTLNADYLASKSSGWAALLDDAIMMFDGVTEQVREIAYQLADEEGTTIPPRRAASILLSASHLMEFARGALVEGHSRALGEVPHDGE